MGQLVSDPIGAETGRPSRPWRRGRIVESITFGSPPVWSGFARVAQMWPVAIGSLLGLGFFLR